MNMLARSTGSVGTCKASCLRSPHSCPVSVSRPARRCNNRALVTQAKKEDNTELTEGLAGASSFLSSAVDSASSLIPESVPRPVAKGGVAIVGGLVVFGLVKQVLSGILTLAVMGGIAYWWLTKDGDGDAGEELKSKARDFMGSQSKGSSNGSSSGSSRRGGADDDLDDPLSEASRIMDKYK